MKDFSNNSAISPQKEEPVMSIVLGRLARLSENVEQGLHLVKKKLDTMAAYPEDDLTCGHASCEQPASSTIVAEIFRLISRLEDSNYKLESINRHLDKIL